MPSFIAQDRNDYHRWIRLYDTPTQKELLAIRKRIETFREMPRVSIIMSCCNPDLNWLAAAINSVCNQSYANWELCIVARRTTDTSVNQRLKQIARSDARIRMLSVDASSSITELCNVALEMVTGKWVAPLDQDDVLSEHALFWLVDAIRENPSAELIYSDEDRIDAGGIRSNPYFKPDWNVDLFYASTLIGHLCVFRASFLREVGGFREGMDGAQNFDLALRCIEHTEPNRVLHIPRVLYHYRTQPNRDKESFAKRAVALNFYFQRNEINASAATDGAGGCRVSYVLPSVAPMVSLIIPTRNEVSLIRRCIESVLEKTTYTNLEIIIIDNGSDDQETIQYFNELRSDNRLRIVADNRPFNYSELNNRGARLAKGKVLALLNNDVEVISPEWLSEMVSIALQPKVGAVGARLWYPDDTLQHGGVILVRGMAGHAHKHLPRGLSGYHRRAVLTQSFSAVTGACLVVRKSIYDEVGGLNETDLRIAFNDVDFCLRLREAGYRNVWTPYAELYHHESASRGFEDTPEKFSRFVKEFRYMQRRWGDLLLNDPAYSPNLTFDYDDFSLAWPPRLRTGTLGDTN